MPPSPYSHDRMLQLNRLWLSIPLLLAAGIVVYSFWGLIQFGLIHLHADQWRILGDYAVLPFPASLLESQNGHRPVIPGLIHYVNWMLLGNNQLPVLWLGYCLAISSAGILCASAWRSSNVSRSSVALVGALSIAFLLWPGNNTTLYRSNESVHSYLVILPLILGLNVLYRQASKSKGISIPSALALVILGFVALLSFGTGLAVFPCFVLMALALGQRRLAVTVLVPALVGALVVYFAVLPGSGSSHGEALAAQVNLRGIVTFSGNYLKWLSSPISHALLAVVPGNIAGSAFQFWMESRIGPVLALASIAYLATCYRQYFCNLRTPGLAELVFAGLAVAMAMAGCIVVLARAKFYAWYPGNVLSNRYFVWSSLYWLGIAALPILRNSRPERQRYSVLASICILLVLLLSSENLLRGEARPGRKLSDHVSLRFALGIIPDNGRWGVNKISSWGYTPQEYLAVLGVLKARGMPIYNKEADGLFTAEPPMSPITIGQRITIRVTRKGTTQPAGSGFAEVKFSERGQPITAIYLLDESGNVVGFMAPENRWLPPFHRSPEGTPELKHYFGFIRDFKPGEIYSYLFMRHEVAIVRGKVAIKNNEQINRSRQ